MSCDDLTAGGVSKSELARSLLAADLGTPDQLPPPCLPAVRRMGESPVTVDDHAAPVTLRTRVGPLQPTRQLVLRPRLVTLLGQRFDRRLLTVVAGAGFGKTSLLSQALAENALAPRGVDAWLGCRPEDGVASTLAGRLLTALEGADTQPPSTPQATLELIEAGIWRRSPTPVALVLDDTHLIPPGSPGARLLTALVDRLPATGHLLLAGRPPLPIPTARLTALGQAVQLGEADLAFDPTELAEFAALRDVAPAVLQHTGGWPALMELTASIGDHRAVEFLQEELLARLPAEHRRFLAAFAAVGGGNQQVADALTDTPVDLDGLLGGLPLVSGTPGERRSLHALWTPALTRELSEAEADHARRRAAAVLWHHGDLDTAVRLLTQAQAWDAVRALICQTASASHPPVAPDVFAAWYSALPAQRQHGPEGLLLGGLVEKGRDLPAAVPLLEQAAQRFQRESDLAGETAALVNLGHICWWQRDVSRLALIAQRAKELPSTAGADELVVVAALPEALLASLRDDSRRALEALDAIPLTATSAAWAAVIAWLRAWELILLGEPRLARRHAEAAARDATGNLHAASLRLRVLSGWFCGDIEQALGELPELTQASLKTGRAQNAAYERGTCALLLAYAGCFEAAGEHLNAAREALTGIRGGGGEVMLALAQAASSIGQGEEHLAEQTLTAELADRPLHAHAPASRLHRLFLPLSYLLVPSTRAYWDAADLGPLYAAARTLAQALVAVRETGSLASVADLPLPSPQVVQALLPVPWSVHLATALTAVGRPEGAMLISTLGAPARQSLTRVADTASGELARAARHLLADLPRLPSHRVQLDLLGPFQLRHDEQPVDHPDARRGRVQQLLAYLVAHPNGTRAAAAAALWPDLPEEAAARNLRVNLTYLQRLLEPDRADVEQPYFIRSTTNLLLLTGGEWLDVDVWRFDQLIDQAEQAERDGTPSRALAAYQQALPLYRGDYLSDLPDVGWAELDRDRLRLRYQSAATRAGELLLASGDTTAPLAWAQAALRSEPYSERAYRLLAATHLARADHAAARRCLQRCQTMLDALGAHPEPQTQMLQRRLGAAAHQASPGRDLTQARIHSNSDASPSRA